MTDPHRPAPLSVLLVDDAGGGDPSEELLRLLGFEVRRARSAAEALAAAGASAPDAVVLAPGLPDGDRGALAEGLVAALACRPLLVALAGGGGVAGQSNWVGFDHVVATADPGDLASLLTDYALVIHR